MKAMNFMKKGWGANLAAIIMMALVLSSCTKEPRCEEPKEPQKECKLKGKFERAMCGWGIYESYWIRLDDGTFLQPCESDVALLDIKTIYEGMPVELSYVPTSKQCGMLACAAWPGEHITVKITCIKGGKPAEEPTGCTQAGTLRDMRGGKLDGCAWLIDLDNGERLDLGEQVDASVYKDGDRVKVGYTEIQNVMNTCMAGKVVQLDCITKEGNTPPPPAGKCDNSGTLRDNRGQLDGCGWSIELDKGGVLELGGQIDENIYNDGDRVKIGYEIQNTPNDCMRGTPAKITCIQKDDSEPTGKCEHMGTLHDMRSKTYGCGWVLELLDGTKLDVSGQIDENLYQDGSVVLVGYYEVINVWNPCNADKAVQLTCISTANKPGR